MEAAESLERRRNERTHQHRGLLLYAMMHPDQRSIRAVARAVGRNEATVRGWAKRWEWAVRIEPPCAEESAVLLYRMLYVADFGATELPEIADRVVVSLSQSPNQEPPPPTVVEDLREADRIAREEIIRRRSQREAVRAQHTQLVDGALGYIVRQMENGKVRASLRDIPSLLKARGVLTGETADQGGAALVTETVRVRQARESGGSVLEAMAADLAELTVILAALRAKEELASGVLVDEQPVAVGDDGPSLSLVE